jgi:hypothetical protein
VRKDVRSENIVYDFTSSPGFAWLADFLDCVLGRRLGRCAWRCGQRWWSATLGGG